MVNDMAENKEGGVGEFVGWMACIIAGGYGCIVYAKSGNLVLTIGVSLLAFASSVLVLIFLCGRVAVLGSKDENVKNNKGE